MQELLDKIFKTENEDGEMVVRDEFKFSDVAEAYQDLVQALADSEEAHANTLAELEGEQKRNAELAGENTKLRIRILDSAKAEVADVEAEPDVDALEDIDGSSLEVL